MANSHQRLNYHDISNSAVDDCWSHDSHAFALDQEGPSAHSTEAVENSYGFVSTSSSGNRDWVRSVTIEMVCEMILLLYIMIKQTVSPYRSLSVHRVLDN